MPKKDVRTPILLPARMNLAKDALAGLKIELLSFPFAEFIDNFRNSIEEVLSSNRNKKVWIPYRQFNNGLLACASTLMHGFEYFDTGDYRALAIGTAENQLRVPTPEQIHELAMIWAQKWTKEFDGKGKADQVNSVCDRFLEKMAIIPTNWNWQPISPEKLIQNLNAEKGLGFQAIPSFLATLLHGKTCVIRSGKREQQIHWRKVQGDGSGRTGLFIVSQPFLALYTDEYGKEAPKDGQEFDKQISKQHQMKLDAWRNFLKQEVIVSIDSKIKPYCFAIIEIGQTKKKGVHPKQSIYRAVREACVLENIGSQMVQTVKPKSADKEDESADTSPSYSKKTEGRILNAVLDVTLRQVGALYGIPSEVYERAGIPKEIAQNLDVIALCRRKATQGQDNIHYALAVRLRATGAVDVLFPNRQDWIPYAQAGIELGQIFSRVRHDRNYKTVQLKGIELAKFAADVLTQVGEQPTLVLIEADVWRNERGEENGGQAWFQLKNEYLFANRDVLDFQHVPGHTCIYPRDHNQLRNLLGIIRFRTGDETTQYITNRQTWDENSPARDLMHLSGFYDTSIPELLHYFSIGRLPKTQKA
ncbi:MAG: RNaseH domain-containing protein [Nostoc sp.]|uniref:RNaseH domain-containing protein n=1 Tax=Nostoc sp. TaxID=1180 RepID=UPI002FF565A1